MDEPESLRKGNCVQACFMYRRSAYEKIGEYRTDMVLVEDYEYWLRMHKDCHMEYLKGPSPYQYRRHDESLSSRRPVEVLVQLARAKALHFPDEPDVRKSIEQSLWTANWAFREAGEEWRALKCAFGCLRLNPRRLDYWRACATGALRCCAGVTGLHERGRR